MTLTGSDSCQRDAKEGGDALVSIPYNQLSTMTSSCWSGSRLIALKSGKVSWNWFMRSAPVARYRSATVSNAAASNSGRPSMCGVRAMTVVRRLSQANRWMSGLARASFHRALARGG
ncbi:hypothetical protein GCM10010271_71010 [Streptomyces kurssanovii]|nr:hypothetical protein GCM10010271_71010 [Streptomyces kurssanovii]